MSDNTLEILTTLRQRFIADPPNRLCVDRQVIWFEQRPDGLFRLALHVPPDEGVFGELLEVVAQVDVSEHLHSLEFDGPDEGCNGTKEWNFRPLIATQVTFPELKVFSVAPSEPGDHNGSIIGWCYDEEGQIADLFSRMPKLHALTVPSAPSAEFFSVGDRPLHSLRVDFGYDRQTFLADLGQCASLPELRIVDLGIAHPHVAGDADVLVPFDEWAALFDAPGFSAVEAVTLRNPSLTDDEIGKLLAIRRDLQLTVVRTYAAYRR